MRKPTLDRILLVEPFRDDDENLDVENKFSAASPAMGKHRVLNEDDD
jgi:hypothetical protein